MKPVAIHPHACRCRTCSGVRKTHLGSDRRASIACLIAFFLGGAIGHVLLHFLTN